MQQGWTTTLDRVRGGEALAILQRGKPAAALLPYSLWQRAAADAPVWKVSTNSWWSVRPERVSAITADVDAHSMRLGVDLGGVVDRLADHRGLRSA
ncbi:hypothetical protein [Nocardia sp. CNY236]|uniref:hypothetical protein n=1 Tax=Nocardia sp. CNY236 TaxID=1169152 RepID=UPI0018CBA09F|nr:hypothetical protein [Nocardia sp. CNY236]